jgi:hypothetical protein
MAGLLTSPGSRPSHPSRLWALSGNGIRIGAVEDNTAAGTVPDSHRIPVHHNLGANIVFFPVLNKGFGTDQGQTLAAVELMKMGLHRV